MGNRQREGLHRHKTLIEQVAATRCPPFVVGMGMCDIHAPRLARVTQLRQGTARNLLSRGISNSRDADLLGMALAEERDDC